MSERAESKWIMAPGLDWMLYAKCLVPVISIGVGLNLTSDAEAFQEKTDAIDLCTLGVEDYSRVDEEVQERIATGISSEGLVSLVGAGSKKNPNRLAGKEGDSGSAKIFEMNVRQSIVRCKVGAKNNNLWALLLVENEAGKVTEASFRLYFEDISFSQRNIPFKFENFRSDDWAELALKSVLPPGSTRQEVEEVLQQVGPHTNLQDGFRDVLRQRQDKSTLEYRVGIGLNTRILILVFDRGGKLSSLNVN